MVISTLCLIVRIFFNNLIIIVEPLMFAFSINAIDHEAFSFAILSPIQIVRLHALHSRDFFLPPYATAPGFEPTSHP